MPSDLDVEPARSAPHAARELAGMFDDVSDRYDLLNRVMSLGQDGAWRAAMWRAVPESAGTVLDLCTGSGVSLRGLRRPGRIVLGMDVSLRMLEIAAGRQRETGWAPRVVCADGFHLPLRDRSLDAITIAFGMRNLRPRSEALAELARVLRPDGTLVVLEATAPASGPFAPIHAFYLRRVVPWLGRLSKDPSAYTYLSRSVFEFGAGSEFATDLDRTGFRIVERRVFLMGATRLWAARRTGIDGQIAPNRPADSQNARSGRTWGENSVAPSAGMEGEWRVWAGIQLVISTAVSVALGYGLWVFIKLGPGLPLAVWQRRLAWLLLGGGLLVFAIRSLILAARYPGPARRP